MKILIAVPCMDLVPSQFAQSLATINRVGECMVAFQMGSLVYDSRNSLALNAIKSNCDYVLWLDSDMVFPSNILEKLIGGTDKGDIITGVYYRRAKPYSPVLLSELEIGEETKWCDYVDYPQNETFEVEGCGFGCVLVPTKVLIDVYAEYGNMFAPINGVGEDLSFCWRARQLGYKIVCDPSIQCGHVGHYVIDKSFYEAFKNAKGV